MERVIRIHPKISFELIHVHEEVGEKICIFFFTFSRPNVSGKQGIDSNFDDRSSKIPNSFSGVWMRQISCVLSPSVSSYSGYMTNFLDVSWNSSTPMFLLDLSFHIKLKKIGSSYELKLSGRVKHILTVADQLFWTGSIWQKSEFSWLQIQSKLV